MVCYHSNHIKELGGKRLIEGQRAGTDSNLSLQNPHVEINPAGDKMETCCSKKDNSHRESFRSISDLTRSPSTRCCRLQTQVKRHLLRLFVWYHQSLLYLLAKTLNRRAVPILSSLLVELGSKTENRLKWLAYSV